MIRRVDPNETLGQTNELRKTEYFSATLKSSKLELLKLTTSVFQRAHFGVHISNKNLPYLGPCNFATNL